MWDYSHQACCLLYYLDKINSGIHMYMYKFTFESSHFWFQMWLWFQIWTRLLADRRIWQKKGMDLQFCIPLFTPLMKAWLANLKQKGTLNNNLSQQHKNFLKVISYHNTWLQFLPPHQPLGLLWTETAHDQLVCLSSDCQWAHLKISSCHESELDYSAGSPCPVEGEIETVSLIK